jgi:hypothetical protein
MKINIALDNTYSQWMGKHGIELCHDVLRHFGLHPDNEYALTIRKKNPRQKGFVRVNMTNPGFWRWDIPSMPSLDCYNRCFNMQEASIKTLLGSKTDCSIWIKFDMID